MQGRLSILDVGPGNIQWCIRQCSVKTKGLREGVGAGGEMTQALYAHMNNKTIKKKTKGLVFEDQVKGIMRFRIIVFSFTLAVPNEESMKTGE
jgi:hypothetical protein